MRLFAHKGIDGTSMRDITREAGVSLGAVYNYYQSKDEMAYRLFAQGWAIMGSNLRKCAKRGSTLEEKISLMVDYVFDLLDEQADLVRLVYLERHRNLGRHDWRPPNPHLVFWKVINDAMKAGEIPRRDTDVLASMVTGAIIQTVDVALLGGIATKDAKQIASTVKGGILALLHDR